LRGIALALGIVGALLLAFVAPASGASKNVQLMDNLPEAKNATAINFLEYKSRGRHDDDDRGFKSDGRGRSLDVMLVTGRFGLKSYSLADPAHPELLDEITAEELRLPGDPPVDFSPDSAPRSTFWQNEDMDVDRKRKLALLSRDPRAYGGSTLDDPGDPNPNNATNIAGVYVVDAKDPRNLQLISFQQLPTGHTTTCINDCKWLWTGGPAASRDQVAMGWTFGRPIIVTDLRNPRQPRAFPQQPVDLFRRDGATAYSHDVQVDRMGIAWVSGDGGTRGYWTEGRHYDPLSGRKRTATPLNPIPYGGGGLPEEYTADKTGGFEHNAWRPVGRDAPKGDRRYRKGELLLATEEDFGPAEDACRNQGQFTISSLRGSFNGEAWRSTPQNPFRLEVVGNWNPFGKEGSRPPGGPYHPLANFCSAHYFDVDGSMVTYAWYGEGTRFLDISDPENPRQFAYWRPEEGIVWASYMYEGYVYTADRVRGVDVLKLTGGATKARKSGVEVVAPSPSRQHRRFVASLAWQYRADPGTGGLCYLGR
jgi:hypothetical protein